MCYGIKTRCVITVDINRPVYRKNKNRAGEIILALSVLLELISLFKSRDFRFWFVLFSIQILIACVVPTGIFLMLPADNETFHLEVSGQLLEDLTPDEAKNILTPYYDNIIDTGEVMLKANGNPVSIPYKMFELQIDASKIFDMMRTGRYSNRYFQLIGKSNQNVVTKPIVSLNLAKLKDALQNYKDIFYKEPVDAGLMLQKGIVKTTTEIEGLELDIDKAADCIKGKLEFNQSKEIIISQLTAPEAFKVLKPERTSLELSGFTQIYGTVQGDMAPDSIIQLQNIVNNIEDFGLAPGEEFSYIERVSFNSKEEAFHSVLVSAIYRAILPIPDIKVTCRKPAKQPISGIDPGFEVDLEREGDLRFLNTSDSELMFIFNIEDLGRWTIALVGRPGLKFGEIKTEKMKITPPVIYLQDNKLPEKSQEVIEFGSDGLAVKVIRVIQDQSIQLYEDIYQPVYRVIAVGGVVKNEGIIRK